MNILEIQLLSADITQTKKFYHEILGMEILDTDELIHKTFCWTFNLTL